MAKRIVIACANLPSYKRGMSCLSWKVIFAVSCLLAVVPVCSRGAVSDLPPVIALKAARLFDGKSKALITNGVVIVQGTTITDAGSNLPIPSGAQVIDLGDATLSPGFMDAHTHVTFDFTGNFNERRLKLLETNVSELALMAIPNARATVEAGFTTVRDLGSRFGGSRDLSTFRSAMRSRRE